MASSIHQKLYLYPLSYDTPVGFLNFEKKSFVILNSCHRRISVLHRRRNTVKTPHVLYTHKKYTFHFSLITAPFVRKPRCDECVFGVPAFVQTTINKYRILYLLLPFLSLEVNRVVEIGAI
jgi:hypothetical protein